jgi:hypothetical protein
MWCYALTIFLSAFLLFQVQPLLAKAILPRFGGAAAVWTTCLLFFQVMLLGGYAYAFWLARQRPVRRQVWIHFGLLGVSLLFLRILPAEQWTPSASASPVAGILWLLVGSIGVPYLALSATGPLLQSWFRREAPGKSPYRLYALSNLGSLLALLSYPFGFEPWLPLEYQAVGWAVLYVGFVAGCDWCAWRVARRPEMMEEARPAVAPFPRWGDRLLWLGLAACGSVLLLATTNQLSQDVSVVPFLWVVPLSLYLVSFILCFDSDRWYYRPVWLGGWPLAAAGVCVALLWGVEMPLVWQVTALAAGLLIGCMVCHGELARRRPAPARLTEFYLLVAAGGALGGVLVAVVAPLVLSHTWEFGLVWPVSGLLVLIALSSDTGWRQRWGRWCYAWEAAGVVLLGVLVAVLVREMGEKQQYQVDVARNFYGVLRVDYAQYEGEDWPMTRLMHGRIVHGGQFAEGEYRRRPISYYAAGTGVGLTMDTLRAATNPAPPALNLGVVGLGAGIMAAWGQTNDTIRFYEINPAVIDLCDRHFTYRQETPARTVVVLGDARLSLAREAAQGAAPLDVLVLDAFSGDSIPLHLLTREAFAVYWRRLKPAGVLAVHVSNRFLRLEPLVRGLAEDSGRTALLISNDSESAIGLEASSWVLVTTNAEFLADATVTERAKRWPGKRRTLVFTDRYSNLFRLLK